MTQGKVNQATQEVLATAEAEVEATPMLARGVKTVAVASMALEQAAHMWALVALEVGLTSLPSRWQILLSRKQDNFPSVMSIAFFRPGLGGIAGSNHGGGGGGVMVDGHGAPGRSNYDGEGYGGGGFHSHCGKPGVVLVSIN